MGDLPCATQRSTADGLLAVVSNVAQASSWRGAQVSEKAVGRGGCELESRPVFDPSRGSYLIEDVEISVEMLEHWRKGPFPGPWMRAARGGDDVTWFEKMR